jgi:aminoglycoside phosphotransferase (APT) family kinase protein
MTAQIREDLEKALGRAVRSVQPIPEGHSGFTYFVSAANGEYVLRLPPPGARIAGTADVMRQGRIMSALHGAGLPVPGVEIIEYEPVIDGRPFILMQRTEGTRIEETGLRERPIEIATSAVEVLKKLQGLPVSKSGIGDEDPVPLTAEMMRWGMLMQRSPHELTTRAGELGGLLAAQVPAERTPTLVHGDYHYGNMLFRGAKVVAILDWEIAEIGQPLLDLGCLCIVAIRRQYQGAPNPGGAIDVSMEQLYDLYGVDAEEMRWYAAMSLYKYASIFGYNLNLHRKGRRPDPMYEGLTDTITGMIDEGISLLS